MRWQRILLTAICVMVGCSGEKGAATEVASDPTVAAIRAKQTLRTLRGIPTIDRLLSTQRSLDAGWTAVAAPITVTLPKNAAGAVRVEQHHAASAWLEIEPRDVAPAELATAEQGISVANDVAPNVDIVFVAAKDRVEELRLFRKPSSALRAEYAIRHGAGIVRLRAVGAALEAVDATGAVLLRTDPIFAVDAAGTRRDAKLVVNDERIVVEVDATGMVAPIALDPSWSATSSPASSHNNNAVLITLADGRALVAGGGTAAADVYDPTTSTWTAVGSMTTARKYANGVLLPSGDVLVIGGKSTTDVPLGTAETFNPSTGTWTATGAQTVIDTPGGVVLLPSGKVFTCTKGGAAPPACQIYDPTARTFSSAAVYGTRHNYYLVALSTGRVLGMNDSGALALYAPSSNTWSALAAPADFAATSVLDLRDGRALVMGRTAAGAIVSSVYDDATGTFTAAKSATQYWEWAWPLPSGNIYLTQGGLGTIYQPATDTYGGSFVDPGGAFHAPILDGLLAVVGTTASRFRSIAIAGACSTAADCESGFCVDGVCCTTDCTAQCAACNVAGSVGTCTFVTGAPRGGRAACSGTGACVGACSGTSASCTYPGATTGCGTASCTGGTATQVGACNGAGSCTVPASTPCAPYVCGATSCKTSCITDTDCAATAYCVSSTCTPKKAAGTACGAAGECSSGNCVDGVCCNTACGGQCEACNVAGSIGTCVPVSGAPVGARPACGGTGACAGTCAGTSSTCTYPGSSTVCAAATCTGSTATTASTCNGSGTCIPGTTTACPSGCAGAACAAIDAGADAADATSDVSGDSSAVDSTASDTAVADTAASDTAVADTAAGDGAVVDTSVVDSSSGDTLADTAENDTMVSSDAAAKPDTPSPGASVCADRTSVVGPDGVAVSCGGYICVDGKCQRDCTNSDECAMNHLCNDGRKCVPVVSNDDDGSCSFAMPRSGSRATAAGFVALGLAIFVARRSRRSVR